MGLKHAHKDANDQCVLLFNEVQKAWKVSHTLQSDLKVCNAMNLVFSVDSSVYHKQTHFTLNVSEPFLVD